jgi:dihydroxyacetone kinase-like protein
MELYIMNKTIGEALRSQGIIVHKTYVGEYMTSLEMAGCSVSVLKLDEELTGLLDAAADTLGWK